MKVIKKIKLREDITINHIQKTNAIRVEVELTNYDTYFNDVSLDAEYSNKLRNQLHKIFTKK